jgi:hypothetical protein
MNRVQAIRAVADKIGLSGPFTNNLVDAMEAVGVLKLEPESPLVKVTYVWAGAGQACCRLAVAIPLTRVLRSPH